jgi:hypothetical protein
VQAQHKCSIAAYRLLLLLLLLLLGVQAAVCQLLPNTSTCQVGL